MDEFFQERYKNLLEESGPIDQTAVREQYFKTNTKPPSR